MKKKLIALLCTAFTTVMLFTACGSQSSPTQSTDDGSQSSPGYGYTTEDLNKVLYDVIEEENNASFKDSSKLTCIMVAKGSGSSKDTYFELTIPKEFVQEDFEMPYYKNISISLPLIVDDYSGDYTLSIKLSEYPDMTNLEELLTANLPSALYREIVSAPYGNDASYKAIYDKKDSNQSWKRTRHGVKYLKRDSDNDGKDIIVVMQADFGSSTNLEIDDIYKILDAVEVKYLDNEEGENLVNDHIRESLGIEYDDSTVVQIPLAISSELNSSYRKNTDWKNVNWTAKELREVTRITLEDYTYGDESINHIISESDKEWLQYLVGLTDLTIGNAVGISNIEFIASLPSLQRLTIGNCDNLTDISAIQNLSSLQVLGIGGCNSLTDISAIQNLSSLQELYISDCNSLTDINAIQDLEYLEVLTIGNCENLTSIGAIQNLPLLDRLYIKECDNLTNIGTLRDLPSVRNLQINGSSGYDYNAGSLYLNYPNITIDVEDLVTFTNIQILTIDCTEVRNLELINNLSTLPNIVAYSIRTPNEEYNWEK